MVSDRLALTQSFQLTEVQQAQLVAEGILSATNLQNFRFFTNDFRTRTRGVDIVATYGPHSRGGTELGLAFNYTGTRVTAYDPDVVDDRRIRQLEKGLSRYRWLLTGKRTLGDAHLLGRLSYYSGWFDSRDDHSYSRRLLRRSGGVILSGRGRYPHPRGAERLE